MLSTISPMRIDIRFGWASSSADDYTRACKILHLRFQYHSEGRQQELDAKSALNNFKSFYAHKDFDSKKKIFWWEALRYRVPSHKFWATFILSSCLAYLWMEVIFLFKCKKFSIEWFSHKTFDREKIYIDNVRHITNSL